MSCVCDSFGVFNLSETLVCLLLASTISKRLNVSGQKRFEKCFLKKHILRKHFEVFHPGTHDRNLGSGFAFDGATPLATIYFGILRNSLTFSPHSFFNSHFFFSFQPFLKPFPLCFLKKKLGNSWKTWFQIGTLVFLSCILLKTFVMMLRLFLTTVCPGISVFVKSNFAIFRQCTLQLTRSWFKSKRVTLKF